MNPDLDALETSAMADVLDEVGYPDQVLDRRIAPVGATRRVAGRAACGSYVPRGGAGAGGAAHKDDFDAIDALAAPGVVVVLSAGDRSPGAVLGGLMTREFLRRGAAGVVTDGRLRDVAEMEALGLPVYGAGSSPVNGARRLQVHSIQQPVELPGESGKPVRVCPGDWIIGDADGLIVLPAAVADDVIAATLRVSEIEREIVQAITTGMPRVDAMRARPRFAHLAALRQKLAARADQ